MEPQRTGGWPPTPIFFLVWAALAVAGFLLFQVNRNAAFKRKYFPWFAALAGAVFLGFMIVIGVPIEGLLFMAPFILLITYLNIRTTSFCDSCGRTTYNNTWFAKAECTRSIHRSAMLRISPRRLGHDRWKRQAAEHNPWGLKRRFGGKTANLKSAE